MAKLLKMILLLSMSLLIFASCKEAPAAAFNIDSIISYKDIPGVTEVEIQQIDKLIGERGSFSYGHLLETEAFVLPDGTKAGFTYKMCDLLTELFGVTFSARCYENWEELKYSLDSRNLDFVGEITPTAERSRLYYMTLPIAERSLRIITNADSPEIVSEEDINGLRVGTLRGVITADSIKNAYPVDFEVVYADSFEDAADSLRTGKIDAFVVDAVADPSFECYDFLVSKEFFSLVYTPVSMTTANPELAPIISVMNKYLRAGGVDKLYRLYGEGDFEYTRYKLFKSFTPQEIQYIEDLSKNGEKVKAAFEYDNYPLSFYNDTDKEFQGVAIDVLKEISRLTDLEFQPMITKQTSWVEILERLKTGEISMVTELIYGENRKNDYIWTTQPYEESNLALLSKEEFPNMAPQQIVRATVGATRGMAYVDMYNTWFPDNDNLVLFNTQTEALEALENGQIDLLMATENILLTLTNYLEKPRYKVNISFSAVIYSLFGFNKNEDLLCSIIDKSQVYIDTESISKRWTNRTFDYSTKLANMRAGYLMMFVLALLVILVVIVFLLLKTRRLTKDLARQTDEAKVASKAKSKFLAHMSHEIRTPLNAIIGMSIIAKNSIDDREKAEQSINQIITSSNHLLGILNDVLDMSKIESGKLELSLGTFNVKEALDEVFEIIRMRCDEKSIKFSQSSAKTEGLDVIGDKLRLSQVLINLLGNAVKFTGDGGEVIFAAAVNEETDTTATVNFSVSDNGIGMSKEQMEKLFTPFEQANSAIAVKYGGTGLGLSISQNIIKTMGGEIKAESRQGLGSKFYFTIKFEKSAEFKSLPKEVKLPNLRGHRILLVEDIDINRIIIQENLSPTGAEIHEAANGVEAVELFQKSPPNFYSLIFMDIQMPIMDGYKATKAIRGLGRKDAATVPIVAMTANAYQEDVKEALAAGMNGHLAKPVDMSDMAKTLRRLIN